MTSTAPKPRHALVCAASSGLGYSVARELLLAGNTVCIVARGEAKLALAREKLIKEAAGGDESRVDLVAADVGQPEHIAAMWRRARHDRPVDILVTNVGGPPTGMFDDLNDADWHSSFENIMMSVVRLARLALPPMREHKWGRIVTITSSSGKEPIPGLMLSNAMRAGVAAITKTLAREVAADGVTVNNVCPGMTDTERLNELFVGRAKKAGTDAIAERQGALSRMPRGKFNSPEEFGAVVRFLCSDEASGVNGVSWFVDGGASASTF